MTSWVHAWLSTAGDHAVSPIGQGALVACAVLLALFGVSFRKRQASGRIGGAISWPKVFWLCFAIYLWFVVCAVVAVDDALPGVLRAPFAAVFVSMWLRGAAEMVMLYGLKNWKPPYGIGHDVFTIALMVAAALCAGATTGGYEPAGTLETATVGLFVVVLVSLIVEIVHARTFFVAMGKGNTTGDDGIWFADDHDPRFIAINRRTRIGNVLLGVPAFAYVALWLSA